MINVLLQEAKPIRRIPLDNVTVYRSNRKENLFEVSSSDFGRVFYIQAPSSDVCEDWMSTIENAAGIDVSNPFDVQHNVHVDFDSDTGFKVMKHSYSQ